ncbi:MAG: cytochrome c [Gammaproteobacteria bacterium]|nr:cytochrome c [Gammaproteobacteria bacterium]
MKTKLALVFCAALTAFGSAVADETKIRLRDAPEVQTVTANCSGCHSLDYIQMNSKFMKRATWEAEVHKMVAVMGAPVTEEDQKRLVDYLVREYGVAD